MAKRGFPEYRHRDDARRPSRGDTGMVGDFASHLIFLALG